MRDLDGDKDIGEWVKEAQEGSRIALEAIVRLIQDKVHQLSMRILVDPEEAKDATQEILVLVVTRLSTFERRSNFNTWVYRVATNYLLNAKKVLVREQGLNFDLFKTDLEEGLVSEASSEAVDSLLLNELRISCTMAMLLCLDLKHRLAYVLGDILELDHTEAAEALELSKDNYRKRLSRARTEVVAFTSQSCGLANTNAKCSCPRRLPKALELGRVSADRISYAIADSPKYQEVLAKATEVESALRTLTLQRETPRFASPEDFSSVVIRMIEDYE